MKIRAFKAFSTASTLALLITPSLALADDSPQSHEEHDTMEELVVTASPIKRSRFDVLQSTAVMSGEELDRNMGTSLGDTLDALPGISNTYFGPGAGRPIIRGLGGDRIRVLTGGIGAIDASSTSPDHAVASDPLTAQSIEVVRGPATLLYGNNAVGGVVNVLDGRIPYARPENDMEGAARIAYGSNANDLAIGAASTFMMGADTAMHLEAAWRDAGDMKVPSFLRSAELRAEDPLLESEEEEIKRAHNSKFDTLSTSLGSTRFFEGGYLGASLSYSENNYGVPAGAHNHEDEEELVVGAVEDEHEEAVRIDLQQWRLDLMGQVDLDGFFQTARVRFGYGDYKHRELEGAHIGTTFLNDGYEGRLEFVQAEYGNWSGAMGVQMRSRNFEAIGDEAFTPPSRTRQLGVFILEEYNADRWTAEVGARFELQDIQSSQTGARRTYNGVSLSTGFSYDLSDDVMAGFTLHRTERAPNAEELLSNGPHIASRAYEIGDINLPQETVSGGEIMIRKRGGRLTASASLFMNNFDNFIYERFTGEEIDHLDAMQYVAEDAKFWGGEVELGYDVIDRQDRQMHLFAQMDYVRATNTVTHDPLPRIPSLSVRVGGEYHTDDFDVNLSLERTTAQKRLALNEHETKGFWDLSTSLVMHPFADKGLNVTVDVRNMLNSTIRHHTSFLKDALPAAGRDIRISLRKEF